MVILLVEEVRLRLRAGELRLRAIPKRSRDKIPYSWGQEIKSPALTESSFLLLRVLSNSEQHWKIYYFYLFIFSHSFLSFCRNWFVADSFVSLFLFLLCEQVMFTFKWGRLLWRQRLIFLFFSYRDKSASPKLDFCLLSFRTLFFSFLMKETFRVGMY